MDSPTKTPAATPTNIPSTTPRDSAASARALTIDGMTCDACVKKVQDALRGVLGVTTHHVKIGTARITADQSGCDAACRAVEAAGFKCHDKSANAACDASDAAYKPACGDAVAPTAQRATQQHSTPRHATPQPTAAKH